MNGTRKGINFVSDRYRTGDSANPTLDIEYNVDSYSYGAAKVTTIQMTLEEELLRQVDRAVKKLGTTRSALIRDSIRQYLKTIYIGRTSLQTYLS